MSLKQSILKTISFFDLFNFPLKPEEVMGYLYQYPKPIHIKELKGTLNELKEEGKLESIHEFWMLNGRTTIVESRKRNQSISIGLWQKVNHYAGYTVHIPFIRMIGICNTLAYNNANETSDIDLFIVVKPGRLWTARLMITALLQFFGVRRHGNKIAGRFCLSFFVTDNQLNMEEVALKPEDPYLAYWVKTLVPIYGRTTYGQFVGANESWLQKNYGLKISKTQTDRLIFDRSSWFKRMKEWALEGKLGNIVEWVIQKSLKPRALKKAAKVPQPNGIVIEEEMLKFHNHDRRKEYCEKWKEKIK